MLVVAGVVCAAVIVTEIGEILATVFVGLGLVGFIGLAFLEVGLSEDREREREQRRVEHERRRSERLEHPERPRRRFPLRAPRRRGH